MQWHFVRSYMDLQPIVLYVMRRLNSVSFGALDYILHCEDNVKVLEVEINRLNIKRHEIKRMVSTASRQNMDPEIELTQWLNNVNKLRQEAAMIYEEFQQRSGNLSSLWLSYKVGKRAFEALSKASSLQEQGVSEGMQSNSILRFEELPSVPIVGMESLLAELHECLHDDAAGVIGIHGMAGVGKTALLYNFHNLILAKESNFSLIIYINVAKDGIREKIADRLGLELGDKEVNDHAALLYKALSNIDFVLLLDGLWEPVNLHMLGIPVRSPKGRSKIIVATRIESICDWMDAGRKIRIKCLPWEYSWKLFQEKIGRTTVWSDTEIQNYGKELAEACDGLPLAIITVARAILSKRKREEWRHSSFILKIAPWKLLGMEKDVLDPIKNSYDNLPSEMLKICLLYCSLFPAKSVIKSSVVIDYWISQGFMDDVSDMECDIYDKGHDIIGLLKGCSLLENGNDEDHIRVHPMVRATALWASTQFGSKENRCLVRSGIGLKDAPEIEKWSDARRVSLMSNEIRELSETPDCRQLRTLMLQDNKMLECLGDDFFQFMTSLRILDLSHTAITRVPPGIKFLSSLQYLNIGNTKIRVVTAELGEAANLQCLILSHMPLEKIQNGTFSKLLRLKVLRMHESFGGWDDVSPDGCTGVRDLGSLRRLKALEITLESSESLRVLSETMHLAGCTKKLLLRDCSDTMNVELPSSNLWGAMNLLETISIANCNNLKDILICDHSEDVEEDSALPNLQKIFLSELPGARIVWRNGCLQNVTQLKIWFCSNMELLVCLDQTEGDTSDEKGFRKISVFPNLEHLSLDNLPNLKGMSPSRILLELPKLVRFEVTNCPKFRRVRMYAPALKEIVCNKQWLHEIDFRNNSLPVPPQVTLLS